MGMALSMMDYLSCFIQYLISLSDPRNIREDLSTKPLVGSNDLSNPFCWRAMLLCWHFRYHSSTLLLDSGISASWDWATITTESWDQLNMCGSLVAPFFTHWDLKGRLGPCEEKPPLRRRGQKPSWPLATFSRLLGAEPIALVVGMSEMPAFKSTA